MTNTSFRFTPQLHGPCDWRGFGRWVVAGFPEDGVALAVEPKSIFPLGDPDYAPVAMPPSLGELHLTAGFGGGPWALFAPLPQFVGDNYGYEVRVWLGREARGETISLLERAMASIRVHRARSVQPSGPS